MSVTIRLSKIGKKNAPAYRIVASTTKSKRGGHNLDILGFFNPSGQPVLFEYDKQKLSDWQKKGAIIADSVQKLIDGKYTYIKYEPNKKIAKEAKEE